MSWGLLTSIYIRLPNICFTHDDEVRLIDFDRAVYHDRESVPAQFFGPYMYI